MVLVSEKPAETGGGEEGGVGRDSDEAWEGGTQTLNTRGVSTSAVLSCNKRKTLKGQGWMQVQLSWRACWETGSFCLLFLFSL